MSTEFDDQIIRGQISVINVLILIYNHVRGKITAKFKEH